MIFKIDEKMDAEARELWPELRGHLQMPRTQKQEGPSLEDTHP